MERFEVIRQNIRIAKKMPPRRTLVVFFVEGDIAKKKYYK